jgi:hypothetical protein
LKWRIEYLAGLFNVQKRTKKNKNKRESTGKDMIYRKEREETHRGVTCKRFKPQAWKAT